MTVAPTPKPPAPAPPKTSSSVDPRFDTWKAAKAAGIGPCYSGKDSEYDWYREADSHGIVCDERLTRLFRRARKPVPGVDGDRR